MKENKQKKNKGLVLLAILLIVMIATFTSLGLYAWAKYRSSTPGDAVAQVAKWSFKMRAGQKETAPEAPFAITRTDGYGDVVAERLAPGTFGKIPVYIDMGETEVLTKLELTFTITDCPRNIKFYASADDRTNNKPMVIEQKTEGGKHISVVTIEKYYDVASVKGEHDETIYWGWAYETLDSENSATEGDQYDKEDSNNDAKLVITATATEVLDKGAVPLALQVQVGDYVNYNPGNHSITPSELNVPGATLSGTVTTASSDSVRVASTENVKLGAITSSTKWRVLDVDTATGTVKIIPEEPTSQTVRLYGRNGYTNAVEVLDKVAAIYGKGYGAESARSITVEDVNKVENYTPPVDNNEYTLYAGTYLFEEADGTINEVISDYVEEYTEQKWVGQEETGYNEYEDIYEDVFHEAEGTMITRRYRPTTETKSTDKYYGYTTKTGLFNRGYYWLASRCVYLYYGGNDFAGFFVRFMVGGVVRGSNALFNSDGSENNDSYAVLPVVTLKSNIQTLGQDESGVWQLK